MNELNKPKESNKNKTIEIWIRGRLLCKINSDNQALEEFERIVARAELTINEREEDGKIIKMI